MRDLTLVLKNAEWSDLWESVIPQRPHAPVIWLIKSELVLKRRPTNPTNNPSDKNEAVKVTFSQWFVIHFSSLLFYLPSPLKVPANLVSEGWLIKMKVANFNDERIIFVQEVVCMKHFTERLINK